MSMLTDVAIIQNEAVEEGQAVVFGASTIVMHPVDLIRLRMRDADPWEVFAAIAEWRLQRALRTFDAKCRVRDAELAFSLDCFVILARLEARALDRRIARAYS